MNENLSPQQFHEMTKEEFESQPGTWFHGSPTGEPGSGGGSFHVGTRRSATEAFEARMGHKNEGVAAPQWITAGSGKKIFATNPRVVGGRITSEMTNTPHLKPGRKYGEGGVAAGLDDWKRASPSEPHSDVRANAMQKRNLKRGYYYINAAEDEGSASAVLPNRKAFKTHEDYLVEARAQGKKIPKRAMKGYSQIPGQGRLF